MRANAEPPVPPKTIKSGAIFSASLRISSYAIPIRTLAAHSIPGVLISLQRDSRRSSELDGLVKSSLFQKSDALGGYRQARSLIEAKSQAGAEQSRLLAA